MKTDKPKKLSKKPEKVTSPIELYALSLEKDTLAYQFPCRFEKWTKTAILELMSDADIKRLHAAEIGADALKKALLRQHEQPNMYYLSAWVISHTAYEELAELDAAFLAEKCAKSYCYEDITFGLVEYSKSVPNTEKTRKLADTCSDAPYIPIWVEAPAILLGYFAYTYIIKIIYPPYRYIDGEYVPPQKLINIVKKDLRGKNVRIKETFDRPRHEYAAQWRAIVDGYPKMLKEPYNAYMKWYRSTHTTKTEFKFV